MLGIKARRDLCTHRYVSDDLFLAVHELQCLTFLIELEELWMRHDQFIQILGRSRPQRLPRVADGIVVIRCASVSPAASTGLAVAVRTTVPSAADVEGSLVRRYAAHFAIDVALAGRRQIKHGQNLGATLSRR